MQSAVRVEKSASIASNGQISTHLPQAMHVASTFRSVSRSRLPHENTAPDGQTYLHQNRGRSMPSSKTARNRAIDT